MWHYGTEGMGIDLYYRLHLHTSSEKYSLYNHIEVHISLQNKYLRTYLLLKQLQDTQ